MRLSSITPEFVEFVPRVLVPGVLYVSQKYKTASHLCACGCGEKVVTPLSPADWQLHIEGSVVSLYPSIGNWDYPCKSHYWIRRSRVAWAGAMSNQQIARVQARDKKDRALHIATVNKMKDSAKAARGAFFTEGLFERIRVRLVRLFRM